MLDLASQVCLKDNNTAHVLQGKVDVMDRVKEHIDMNMEGAKHRAVLRKGEDSSIRHVNRFSPEEISFLEETFIHDETPDRKRREEITKHMNKKRHRAASQKKGARKVIELTQMKIKYWFDHKRRKVKAKRVERMERHNSASISCDTAVLEAAVQMNSNQNSGQESNWVPTNGGTACQSNLQGLLSNMLMLNNVPKAAPATTQTLWDMQAYLQQWQTLALVAMQFECPKPSPNMRVFQLQPKQVLLAKGQELLNGFLVLNGAMSLALYAKPEDAQPLLQYTLPKGSYLGPSKELGVGNMLIQAQSQCQIMLIEHAQGMYK